MVRYLKHLLFCGFLYVTLPAGATVQSSPSYEIIDLGGFQAGDAVQADGINNSGVVVGGDENTGIGFSWNGSSLQPLPPLAGDSHSGGNAVNSLGWVIGQSFNVGEGEQATMWVNGTPTLLPVNATYVNPLGINTAGTVVGTTGNGASGTAFLLQAGAHTSVSLGTLGGQTSQAYAINDAGTIVGSADAANGNSHAFVYQSGHMTQLTDLGLSSAAYTINQQGVAGGFVLRANFTRQAALWSANGTLTELPGLSGFADAEVWSVNQGLQAVGDADGHAVLWSGGTVQSLLSLIPTNSGWSSLNFAYSINDSGEIVGWGRLASNNSVDQAFLLVPAPEPSTWALFAFAGVLVFVLRRACQAPRA